MLEKHNLSWYVFFEQGTRNESGINDKEKERAFKLHHSKKQYIFLAASKEDSLRCVSRPN